MGQCTDYSKFTWTVYKTTCDDLSGGCANEEIDSDTYLHRCHLEEKLKKVIKKHGIVGDGTFQSDGAETSMDTIILYIVAFIFSLICLIVMCYGAYTAFSSD